MTGIDLDRVPCGYLACAADGLIEQVNETFLAWTGFGRDELVGRRSFADLLSVGGRIYHETHVGPLLHVNGRVEEIALEIVCADGSRLPILVNALLEPDAAAPPTIQIAVFAASERRHYEKELLDAKRRAEESEERATVLARTLQQTLIPPAPPVVPGLDIAAAYRPAGTGDEIGGDFYDVFQVSEGDWVAVVGDVCGKGAEAAVVTASARHAIRALAVREPDPSALLHELNDLLLQGRFDRFCTLAVARLRCTDERWTVTVSSGGHPLPVLTGAGAQRRLGHPGSLVGAIPKVTYRDEASPLARGDALVLFTDGVTEARRHEELYGDERVTRWLREHRGSAADLTSGLLDQVMAFQGDTPRDDIVILAVRVP